jgi:hypothetical protein
MCNSPQTVRELKVWQKSMDLVDLCYRLSGTFPKHEIFGLTSQYGAPQPLFPQISPKDTVGGTLRISRVSLLSLVVQSVSLNASTNFCRLGYLPTHVLENARQALDEVSK